MCLIISQPSGGEIPPDFVANAIRRNPDGWGIMGAHRGEIVTRKGIDPLLFNSAIATFPATARHVHFRYATHGAIDLDNCHPFPILNGMYAIMHNGIIDTPIVDKSRSDTWHFCNRVLTPILKAAPGLFGTDEFAELCETIVGRENKLVILRADGDCVTINADRGVVVDGLWLSNAHSIAATAPTPARAPIPASAAWDPWEEDDTSPPPADIFAMADMTFSEASELCASEPDVVAELIFDFLDSWAEWNPD